MIIIFTRALIKNYIKQALRIYIVLMFNSWLRWRYGSLVGPQPSQLQVPPHPPPLHVLGLGNLSCCSHIALEPVDHLEFDDTILVFSTRLVLSPNGIWECWGVFLVVMVTEDVLSVQYQDFVISSMPGYSHLLKNFIQNIHHWETCYTWQF